jgi:hypothetical protein
MLERVTNMKPPLWMLCLLFCAVPLAANDIVYLQGQVRRQDGSAPGRSAVIVLACPGADPVRQTTAGKNGKFYLKVERDDFNHVARALPATATDVGGSGQAGNCAIAAQLEGYDSSRIELANFTIGKDLKLPPLVIKPNSGATKGSK